jgi:hypothetical protein
LTVAIYPHPGGSDQFAPLAPVHGLHRSAKLLTRPRLDLDKGYGAISGSNEVDVPVAVPEPALKYSPALTLKPALGDAFPADAQDLVMARHGNDSTTDGQHERHRPIASVIDLLRVIDSRSDDHSNHSNHSITRVL